MSFERGGSLLRGHVPQLDSSVPSTCCQQFAVWGKCDRPNRGVILFECDQVLLCGQVPQLERMVYTCRSECFAIRRKRDGADNISVTCERQPFMPCHGQIQLFSLLSSKP